MIKHKAYVNGSIPDPPVEPKKSITQPFELKKLTTKNKITEISMQYGKHNKNDLKPL
jgi:hypothetical protein